MIIPLGFSGSRYGMKLKFSAKKLLDKRWLLMVTVIGSRYKSTFYRPENKVNSVLFWKNLVRHRVYKWSPPKVMLFGILSMLIMWQVRILKTSENCEKMEIFNGEGHRNFFKFSNVVLFYKKKSLTVIYRSVCKIPTCHMISINCIPNIMIFI